MSLSFLLGKKTEFKTKEFAICENHEVQRKRNLKIQQINNKEKNPFG
jgi:hypothetical protein